MSGFGASHLPVELVLDIKRRVGMQGRLRLKETNTGASNEPRFNGDAQRQCLNVGFRALFELMSTVSPDFRFHTSTYWFEFSIYRNRTMLNALGVDQRECADSLVAGVNGADSLRDGAAINDDIRILVDYFMDRKTTSFSRLDEICVNGANYGLSSLGASELRSLGGVRDAPTLTIIGRILRSMGLALPTVSDALALSPGAPGAKPVRFDEVQGLRSNSPLFVIDGIRIRVHAGGASGTVVFDADAGLQGEVTASLSTEFDVCVSVTTNEGSTRFDVLESMLDPRAVRMHAWYLKAEGAPDDVLLQDALIPEMRAVATTIIGFLRSLK